MQTIYLDNAATTAIDPEVIDAMLPYLREHYGNPSSIYSLGRKTRLAIEESRKKVASLLSVKPSEIFFTSGGTESSNLCLQKAIQDLQVTEVITSPLEHPATLNTLKILTEKEGIPITYVGHHPDGSIDLEKVLTKLETTPERALFSLMYANNEIATVHPIPFLGKLCREKNILFHSDMVQAVCHIPVNLKDCNVQFASISGHKFHGPKGVGVAYIDENVKISPFILGGGQERNMRGGTENVAGIVGLAKAMEIAIKNMEKDIRHIQDLKRYCKESIKTHFPDVQFNGDASANGLPTILNFSFPENENTTLLQMKLDMMGICISGGSACSSGALGNSHVIRYIRPENNVPLRVSFSRFNTKDDVDELIGALQKCLNERIPANG